jgi:hypothetical protein
MLVVGVMSALLVGFPRTVRPGRQPSAPLPVVSRPQTDIPLEPASTETRAVPTSGGLVKLEDDIEGELLIESTPPGTHVVVNGIARGTTPMRLRYLPIGSYTIRLVREGYESKEASAAITREKPVSSISISLNERLP